MTKKVSTYTKATVWLIIALTIFRFWFCTKIELVGDEAYYWLWSKHLDWSYFSKGPGVAWTMFAGTFLMGDNVFGVRWISVLLAGGTATFMFLLARMLFSEKTALWSIIVAALMPIFMVGSILMTIDPLSVFFWAWAAWLFWRKKDSPHPSSWIPIGLIIGAGVLCKYTNIAQLVCLALFCFWVPAYRKKWRHFGVMTLATLFCFLPVLIWNAQNNWITFQHLMHRGALDKSWVFSFSDLLEFVKMQFLVFNPFFVAALLIGFLFAKPHHWRSANFRYLLCLFFPLVIFYLALSLNKTGQANWTAPAWFAGAILVSAFWFEFEHLKNIFSNIALWCARVVIVISVVFFIGAHTVVFLFLPDIFSSLKTDPLRRLRGSKDIALQVFRLQEKHGTSFLIASNYAYASLLAFYHPDQPQTYVPSHEGIQNQFSFWPDYRDGFQDESALFLTDSNEIPDSLKKEFETVELIKGTFSSYQGKPLRKFYIFVCSNLKN
ncbi:MAG: ArnT family glycosyltransferase [Verrucomicrobiota bacterium]